MKYSNDKQIHIFVKDFLHGNTDWQFRKGKKHNALIAPDRQKIPIPKSPSDWRAYRNLSHDIKKIKDMQV